MNATATVPTHCACCVDEDDGAVVRRLFPSLGLLHLDPFIVLDELHVEPPASVPAQPHCAFESLTYVLEGDLHHRDGAGNERRLGAGGVHRFTAGKGAAPSAPNGSATRHRAVQLWINLPGGGIDHIEAASQHIDAAQIPETRNHGALIRTIVGDGSPVSVQTPVQYFDIALERGARQAQSFPEGWNGLVYVVEGQVALGEVHLGPGEAAFPPAGGFHLEARAASRLMVIAGQPYGPDQCLCQCWNSGLSLD